MDSFGIARPQGRKTEQVNNPLRIIDMRNTILTLSLALFCVTAEAKDPDCTNPNAWPASIAYVELKNAGILTPEPGRLRQDTSCPLSFRL